MTSEPDQQNAAEISDDDIALRIMEREKLGLIQLLEKYGGKVKAFLGWKHGAQLDDEDRTDILHKVAFQAWRYIDSFDESKGSLGVWLVAIAQNEAIDFLQRERLPVVELEQDPLVTDDVDEMTPERRKLFEDLDRVMDELPARQKAVAKEDLRCGGEADGPTLAKKLGTTSNAIRVARSKARKTIAEKMTKLGHNLGGDA